MRCPRDDSALTQIVQMGTTIDMCGVCHGKWLDEGEVESLVRASTRSGAKDETLERAILVAERSLFVPVAGVDTELACPRCSMLMQKICFASGDVELRADRCASCRGLWFDRGEASALFVLIQEKLPVRRLWLLAAVVLGAIGLFWLISR